ncbi:MAG TPA: DegQ family serine endoprotease [Usitatibacter sp.]|jgi:serine protease Do|nr:DegQ family serine endoprotease [Usitatibacter sp.]
MKSKSIIATLVAAGLVAGGAAAWRGHLEGPYAIAHAAAMDTVGGVAAPAANPRSSSLPLNGFSQLVAQYGPAVVNITVEGSAKVASNGPDIQIPGMDPQDPLFQFFRGFRGGPQRSVPMRGEGSGFIVSHDGYILTNAHVVDHANLVNVKLTDRREFKAKVVGVDKDSDIALIKIDAKNLPTVKLGNSRDTKVGEWVVAIGSPYGFENSVTAGIVSAKSRSLPDATYVPFIQTDVAVNPGNSGGPLFNLAGEVIGINSQIYSRTGGFQGLSFAIPIEVAMNVKDQLLKSGHVTRGHLGVTVQEVNATLADSFGLDRPRGALVASVDPDSPAAKGGIKVGDIILSYNGNPIERSSDLPLLVANTTPGEKASIEVWRDHGNKNLTVAAGETKDENVASNDEGGAASGKLGLAVRPLSPQEREENDGQGGLLVEQVSGAAAHAGVQPGDIVLSLNGKPVRSASDLRAQVEKSGKHVALLIQRNDRQLFVPIELG